MPIRHDERGWWWGSRGPFKTRAKAEEVARAAYAHGYRGRAERAVSGMKRLAKRARG